MPTPGNTPPRTPQRGPEGREHSADFSPCTTNGLRSKRVLPALATPAPEQPAFHGALPLPRRLGAEGEGPTPVAQASGQNHAPGSAASAPELKGPEAGTPSTREERGRGSGTLSCVVLPGGDLSVCCPCPVPSVVPWEGCQHSAHQAQGLGHHSHKRGAAQAQTALWPACSEGTPRVRVHTRRACSSRMAAAQSPPGQAQTWLAS